MQVLEYITDEKGKKKAVIIDLKKYADLWEDFYDGLIAKKREKEPRISLEKVKKSLAKK
ncbi:MAG: hypothetical protein OEZ22_12480 [Spirochaetia bacterium]|nr:hypothetical protein [Spirochaetia bacterium]